MSAAGLRTLAHWPGVSGLMAKVECQSLLANRNMLMKTLLIAALVLTVAVPFLASADICGKCGKPECANGPIEFGEDPRWKGAPTYYDPLWGWMQRVSETE